MSPNVSSTAHEREKGEEWPWNIDLCWRSRVHVFLKTFGKKYCSSKEKHSHAWTGKGRGPWRCRLRVSGLKLHTWTPNTFLLAFSLPAGATFGKWKASRYNGILLFFFPRHAPNKWKRKNLFAPQINAKVTFGAFDVFKRWATVLGKEKRRPLLEPKKINHGVTAPKIVFFSNSTEIFHWFGGWWMEQRPSSRTRR